MKIGQCYVFNPPSSTCSVDLKAKIVEITIFCEKLELRRIRFMGEPISNEDSSVISNQRIRFPLTTIGGRFSSKFKNYIPFHVHNSYSVKLNDTDSYHTYTFEEPVDISGFLFNDIWSHLKTIVIEYYQGQSRNAVYTTRIASKYSSKECYLVFPKRLKWVKVLRIWYLRLSDNGRLSIQNAPIPVYI